MVPDRVQAPDIVLHPRPAPGSVVYDLRSKESILDFTSSSSSGHFTHLLPHLRWIHGIVALSGKDDVQSVDHGSTEDYVLWGRKTQHIIHISS